MNPVTDHPLSLPQTTLSMAVAHKSGGSFHLGEGHRPFYHLLKTPFGAISHVAQLDTAHPFCCVSIGYQGSLTQTSEKWPLVKWTHEMLLSNVLSEYPCVFGVTLSSVLFLHWNSVMLLINSVFTFTSQTVHTQGLNILDICLLAQMWWMD